MTDIKELENEVQRLNRMELASFREWFLKYDTLQWDKEIEEDSRSGKLNRLAKQALEAHKSGRTKKL